MIGFGTLVLALALSGGGEGGGGTAVAQAADSDVVFAVLGHLRSDFRGQLHPRLREILARVAQDGPDFVVLTGDAIVGRGWERDTLANLRREWTLIDSALAGLDVPVYRVPGNHDIADLPTRDVYAERYGLPPQAVDVGAVRLLLLHSGWIPPDGDTRVSPYNTRQSHIDSAQIRFLRRELADTAAYAHAFVFMHHLLWWKADDAPWWRDVHPLLAAGKVAAVFSGDWGPEKFSTMERDGVRYFQSSMSPGSNAAALRRHEWNRMLAQQFDNYLLVRVDGPDVEVEVRVVGAVSSGDFTPARWREMYGRITRPPAYVSGRTHLRRLLGTARGRVFVAAVLLVVLGVGLGIGWAGGWVWCRKGRTGHGGAGRLNSM